MRLIIAAVLTGMLYGVAAANGPAIDIADVTVPEGTTSASVPITISGGQAVSDMVLFLQVGHGGTVTGNPPVPQVTGFEWTGSIWEDAPGGFTKSHAFAPPDEIPDVSLNLDVSGETVAADGLLLSFTVDTSDMEAGDSYDLSLTTSFGDQTDLGGPAGKLAPTLDDGSITMVPEPATLCLLGVGAATLLRRRKL